MSHSLIGKKENRNEENYRNHFNFKEYLTSKEDKILLTCSFGKGGIS